MAAGTARVCHDPHVSPSRRSVRALALACLAATVLLGAGAPLASASGGAGTVTSGGVHVGMPTAEADGREHRAAIIGCAEGMALRHGRSALVIAMSGGHREGRRRLVGGHVALLAVDSTLRRPGVFVCI
jgi:hypothetical protein